MNLEQNVTVGMGGDGTPSPGNWMEGAVIAGTTSDATDNALQGNFVSFFGPAQTAVPNTVRANLTYSINGYTSPATTALPAKGLFLNQVVYTTNAASYSDCTAGAGTTFNACRWNGTIWTPLFPTGGSMVWPTFTGLAKYGGSSNWVTPTYADVVALFGSGSCSGYLKNDGTCGTPAGSGTVSGQANGVIPLATASTTIGAQSHLDDGVTTANTITSSEAFAVNCPSCPSQSSLTYNTGHPLVPGSSTTAEWAPSTAGLFMISEAGGAFAEACTSTNGVCASPVATIINSGAITVTAQNTYVYCTGNCTITPLAPALNVQLCVRNGYDTDAVVTLAALGSGKSYELIDHTTLGTPNHTVVSGGGGYDESCWLGVSTTAYSNWNSSGTWVD
jgi:hypothetical protein